MDSFGSSMPRGGSASVLSVAGGSSSGAGYQQSIGFANALSQAIGRDEMMLAPGNASIMDEELRPSTTTTTTTDLLEDESLELAGAPWAKEGMVVHKHHLDGVEKRSRDRNWSEVFAVVQKGHMTLFSFTPTKSIRSKSRMRVGGGIKIGAPSTGASAGVVVGVGNWQDNATQLATFNLRQTLASALPPPGYSRTRPHVWALSLPTGAVHLFQVGTPEIVREFVNTANYWSARLSTHPLIGGVSNVEYGWGEAIVSAVHSSHDRSVSTATDLLAKPQQQQQQQHARTQSTATVSHPPLSGSSAVAGRRSRPGSSAAVRTSISSSVRSFDPLAAGKPLPGDKAHIAEWTPPQQSLRASTLSEHKQLESLDAYVRGIETELQTHNELRGVVGRAYSTRGQNGQKAMANWERKSAYLLREIVRFRTYVDGLADAGVRRSEVYAERRGGDEEMDEVAVEGQRDGGGI